MPATENVLVSIAFGTALLVLAGGMALKLPPRGGDSSWGAHPVRMRLIRGRRRRRVWIAGLLALLGVLIPAGDIWLTAYRDPRGFAVYVLAVLGLSVWLLWLGLLEGLASMASVARENRRQDLE